MHILTARVILEEEGPRPQIACGAWSAGALMRVDLLYTPLILLLCGEDVALAVYSP